MRQNAASTKKVILVVGALALLAITLLGFTYWRQETVVQFPLQGYPGVSVDFVLCYPMIGERGWAVRFGGSETKAALIPGDVSAEEIKAKARVTYDGQTLSIFGPRGEQMTVPGFRP
jgi:hypothetical protein